MSKNLNNTKLENELVKKSVESAKEIKTLLITNKTLCEKISENKKIIERIETKGN
jgi:hypothetical protein